MNLWRHTERFKQAILLAIGVTLVIVGFGCARQKKVSQKPIISVSIQPQKYFVERIAGDHYEINVLIPAGASPASYDPLPSQIKDLSNSVLYFKIGQVGFEKAWIENLEKDLPHVTFFDLSSGIKFIDNHDSHETDIDHDHCHTTDPHIWMSPRNVKVIAQNIFVALTGHNPQDRSYYQKRLDIFLNEIDSVDLSIERVLSGIDKRDFIIYHPALTYYARDYNLHQIPMELEGKEPTSLYMKTLIDTAKENNITAILVQKQFSQDEASTLQKEINGKIIRIDPLDYNWQKQIIYISKQLQQALSMKHTSYGS